MPVAPEQRGDARSPPGTRRSGTCQGPSRPRRPAGQDQAVAAGQPSVLGEPEPEIPTQAVADLERDLLKLERVLEALPFPRDQAPEVLKPLLADRKIRSLVTRSAVALTVYVDFRKSLTREAPKQPDPYWLLGKSATGVQALKEVRGSLGPLKQSIERLTPGIP